MIDCIPVTSLRSFLAFRKSFRVISLIDDWLDEGTGYITHLGGKYLGWLSNVVGWTKKPQSLTWYRGRESSIFYQPFEEVETRIAWMKTWCVKWLASSGVFLSICWASNRPHWPSTSSPYCNWFKASPRCDDSIKCNVLSTPWAIINKPIINDIMSHAWSGIFDDIFDGILDAQDSVQAYFSHDNHLGTPHCTENLPYGTVSPGCPSDCDDPAIVFGNPSHGFLLWHCVLYPNITNHFRQGILSEANSCFLVTNHVDTSLAKAANVTLTISTCLTQYCESLAGCNQEKLHSCSVTALSIDGSMLNIHAMDSCMRSICANHPEPLASSDIAGPGVAASYIVQAGIPLLSALTLFVLVFFLENAMDVQKA